MNDVTKWLAEQLEAVLDPDYNETMDDMINSERVANQILRTSYKNADYAFLREYAQTLLNETYRLNFS